MKRKATLTAAVILGVGGSYGAEVTPAYYFDCDAPEERAAVWMRDLTSLPATVTGMLEVAEVKSHPKWLASFAIVVRNPDGASPSGLRVGWPVAEPRVPYIEAVSPKLRSTNQRQRASWNSTGKVSFTISVAADGETLFKVGDSVFSDKLDVTKPLKLTLTCSTAEVIFDSVKVQ